MLDPQLIRELAGELETDEGFIEKDWHVVRAMAAIASIDLGDVHPVFSGGTSLSKGWNLIRRFSEDIDFKVVTPSVGTAAARKLRSACRIEILEGVAAAGFTPIGEPLIGNASHFFRASFGYGATVPTPAGMRPELKIEIVDDPQWQAEYEHFVDEVAFGPEDQRIGFDTAVTACRRLVEKVLIGLG